MNKGRFELPVKAKLKGGQIIVEQKICGIIFSFPKAVWPANENLKRLWVERLTPWWDINQPDRTPQAQRLREKCINEIERIIKNDKI